MSKTLALIHTSAVLVPSFTSFCAKLLPDSAVFHMVNKSLIKNTIAAGSLQKTTIRRLVALIDSAGQAGADAVLVTCSSLGEGVRVARELFDFPVLRGQRADGGAGGGRRRTDRGAGDLEDDAHADGPALEGHRGRQGLSA